ncbi:MAG: CoA ester lyase [Thermodesulfobacteriota bacterium]
MTNHTQRSMLILPANVRKFVEKACLRGADAVVLDLEDSVPLPEKAAARAAIQDAIPSAGRGGADVLVRVNNDPQLLQQDLAAAVQPGLHAVFFPKVEEPAQILDLETRIAALEQQRGLAPGSVKIAAHIESPKGVLNVRGLAFSSSRVESMSLGPDDYCLELGVDPSPNATELFMACSMLAVACKAAGINPMGVLGTVAGFRDSEGFERTAEAARQIGFTGAYCIHPDQVPILNRVFTPLPEKVDFARRVVTAFEEGLAQGRASISLDGRMVDTPVYKRGKALLERARIVAEKDAQKARAMALLQ